MNPDGILSLQEACPHLQISTTSLPRRPVTRHRTRLANTNIIIPTLPLPSTLTTSLPRSPGSHVPTIKQTPSFPKTHSPLLIPLPVSAAVAFPLPVKFPYGPPQASQALAPFCPQYPTQTGPAPGQKLQLPGQPEGERHWQVGCGGSWRSRRRGLDAGFSDCGVSGVVDVRGRRKRVMRGARRRTRVRWRRWWRAWCIVIARGKGLVVVGGVDSEGA